MNHPASRQPPVTHADVASENNKTAMNTWLEEVMREYKRKQFAGEHKSH